MPASPAGLWSYASPPTSYAGSRTALEITAAVPMVRGGMKAHSSSVCKPIDRVRMVPGQDVAERLPGGQDHGDQADEGLAPVRE
ncbi:hypothetical protein ABZ572_37710 [Streptomyces sp. NPDC018338]|uniref:hypothetical protein n=1 Tax=Streptomyces sp. NPDC018338 TaxID=3157192 RepID=UPI00340033D6